MGRVDRYAEKDVCQSNPAIRKCGQGCGPSSVTICTVERERLESCGGISIEKNAVDNAVLTWARSDSDTALVGFDNCALHENITSNIVRV